MPWSVRLLSARSSHYEVGGQRARSGPKRSLRLSMFGAVWTEIFDCSARAFYVRRRSVRSASVRIAPTTAHRWMSSVEMRMSALNVLSTI